MARVQRFEYKFPGMRKPDSFIVYPQKADERHVIVQGSRSIALIEGDGVGWLNYKGSNSKYFVHLNPALGGERVTFPVDFLRLVIEHQTHSGDLIGSSPATGSVWLA